MTSMKKSSNKRQRDSDISLLANENEIFSNNTASDNNIIDDLNNKISQLIKLKTNALNRKHAKLTRKRKKVAIGDLEQELLHLRDKVCTQYTMMT